MKRSRFLPIAGISTSDSNFAPQNRSAETVNADVPPYNDGGLAAEFNALLKQREESGEAKAEKGDRKGDISDLMGKLDKLSAKEDVASKSKKTNVADTGDNAQASAKQPATPQTLPPGVA